LAITETWIYSDHPDAIKLDPAPSGYTIFHGHRTVSGAHGGTALVIRRDLRANEVKLTGSYTSFEVVAVQLSTKSGRLVIVTLYRSPCSAEFSSQLQDLLDEVTALLVRERSALATIIISRRVYLSGCLSGCLSVRVFKMLLLRQFLSD